MVRTAECVTAHTYLGALLVCLLCLYRNVYCWNREHSVSISYLHSEIEDLQNGNKMTIKSLCEDVANNSIHYLLLQQYIVN